MKKLNTIDKYLILCELHDNIMDGYDFKYKKLSNSFIDWLFNHYYTVEFSIHYFDMIDENTGKHRLDFRNWIDPYGKGIWHMSQKSVDKMSKKMLKDIRKRSICKRERVYVAEKDDYVLIYWYGRDVFEEDYWWVFRKNGSKNEEWRF